MSPSDLAVVSPLREGYREQPDYRISFEPSSKRVKVLFNGVVLAATDRAMVLRETRLDPVYYLPRDAVRMAYLEPSDHRTYCPFKGTATYWHVAVNGRRVENAVWSYEDPMDEAAPIAGYLGFYWNKMDAWYADDEELAIDAGATLGRNDNPFVGWLLREAWEAADAEELVARFANCLLDRGFPVWRFNILLGTLNPLVSGTAFVWTRGQKGVEQRRILHARRTSKAFLDSPLVPIYEGRGGLRRRLEGPDAQVDFPILADLQAQGATDYVAMPLHFSDGHINALTLATDRPGGFTTENLGELYEILPLLSRLFEVHALKSNAKSLLSTYLGARSAGKVLDGKIRRGDGETIPAVIWHSDLRDSTRLAATLPREDYLALLNDYFDAAAGAVLAEGGEVLKFIGDAVLAIFPIEDCEVKTARACEKALTAAQNALARLAEVAVPPGFAPLRAGVALHKGEVTYGNVGAAERLDFTVIGRAANEVARLGELCKTLDSPILLSGQVAQNLQHPVTALGRHCLRGTDDGQEVFAPTLNGSPLSL
ncbi:MAG TPA: DUF427 domain-containing protein [Kiloniellaceae bacterium]|nr:DUF427 domain-containing protein [Kiloniellaceae bacterium]